MSRLILIIILVVAVIAAVVLLRLRVKKSRVHTIDTVELMHFHDAMRTSRTGRRRWAPWVILATAVFFLLWSLLA